MASTDANGASTANTTTTNRRNTIEAPFVKLPGQYVGLPLFRYPSVDPVDSYTQVTRDVAQSGSAPALGAGGRRFKSAHPDVGPPKVETAMNDQVGDQIDRVTDLFDRD